jgi:hypothetical protein
MGHIQILSISAISIILVSLIIYSLVRHSPSSPIPPDPHSSPSSPIPPGPPSPPGSPIPVNNMKFNWEFDKNAGVVIKGHVTMPSGKMISINVPHPTYSVKSGSAVLIPPKNDNTSGPSKSTKPGAIIKEIGGPVSEPYAQIVDDVDKVAQAWSGGGVYKMSDGIGYPNYTQSPNTRLVLFGLSGTPPVGGYKPFIFHIFIHFGSGSTSKDLLSSTSQPKLTKALSDIGRGGVFDGPAGIIGGQEIYTEFDPKAKSWDHTIAPAGNDDAVTSGVQYRNRLFQYLIMNGYCVIIYSSVGDWHLEDGTLAQERAGTGGDIWPGGEAAALRKLIDEMYDGTMFNLLASTNKTTNKKLNMNKLVMGGYSSGGHMTSRCINEFPKLKTFKGKPFPKIRAAWFLGSGSYKCYQTEGNTIATASKQCGWTPTTQAIGKSIGYPQWSPTWPVFVKYIGCCPDGQTEERYEMGEKGFAWKTHPAVIMTNSINDNYADPNGTTIYSNVLYNNLKNVVDNPEDKIVVVNTYWTSGDCNNENIFPPQYMGRDPTKLPDPPVNSTGCISHTFFPEMIYTVTAFFEYHTQD